MKTIRVGSDEGYEKVAEGMGAGTGKCVISLLFPLDSEWKALETVCPTAGLATVEQHLWYKASAPQQPSGHHSEGL